MKIITLTKNQYAIVDDEDYNTLSKYKWHYTTHHSGKGYAARGKYLGGGAAHCRVAEIGMHRQILGLRSYKEDPIQIDHINGNKLDNRKENLRLVTQSLNMINRPLTKLNKSGYRGVSWSKSNNKWHAQITRNKKVTSIGYYQTPEEAAKAYTQYLEKLPEGT